ncbi:MAG: GNAT family N-acetyltransferase, partial [Armatimonadota bacterium]
VGTRADFRGRGVGTAMIQAAAEFLRERVEALMVYRGAERSAGYRFYEKSGHRDLIYMRTLSRPPGEVEPADVAVGGREDLIALQPQLLRVFQAAFGEYGGFPPRSENYWERALSDMIFVVIPQRIIFVRYPAEGELQAYCIASVREQVRPDEAVSILEIAGTGADAVREVLRGICAEGARRGWPVNTIAGVDSPYRVLMRAMGFEEGLRHTMIMGQAIAPARLFERACEDQGAVAELRIKAWSPSHDWTLWEGPQARREITLEGKEIVLHRLLTRRLDVRAAVASDLLTIAGEQPDDRERLAAALPYCKWEYHRIDWT